MITITETAHNHIEKLISTNAHKKNLEPSELFLRIYIAGSGPQGIQHGMALTNEQRDDDFIVEQEGIKILVDRMSESYLIGSEIDYIEHELGSNFKIKNPNQIASVDCGSCSGDAGCC